MKHLIAIFYMIVSTATAMVGYTIHHSLFWSIIDYIFTGLAWVKWLICHQVNWTIIKSTFGFLAT